MSVPYGHTTQVLCQILSSSHLEPRKDKIGLSQIYGDAILIYVDSGLQRNIKSTFFCCIFSLLFSLPMHLNESFFLRKLGES